MNKKFRFYIFLLLMLSTCKIYTQNTWEYYYKKDNRAEKIDFVEEISDNNLELYEYGSWMKKFDADGNSVGTSDIPKSSWEITVYPNPSQGDFKVDIGGNARDTRLKLFDMQGKLVKTYDNLLSGINRLNLQNLSQGMYVWKMEKDGKILGSGKWVKR